MVRSTFQRKDFKSRPHRWRSTTGSHGNRIWVSRHHRFTRLRLTSSKERSRPRSSPPGFYLDRPFKPTTFLVVQPDGDRIVDVADEFERSVVIVSENFMSKGFI